MIPPSFSIVVPTFRRPAALRATLQPLLAQEYPREDFEVIVVDDDSSQATVELIKQLADQAVEITLTAQKQGGAAKARNRGARLACGQVVLFVDDDILVEPDHLRRHWEARERHSDPLVGGVWDFTPATTATLQATPFGRYRLELEGWFQAQARGYNLGDGCQQIQSLPAANLAIRRDLFWELGGFDEHFPVAGAEDQDFSLRAREAGCLLLRDPAIHCLHNDSHLTLRAYAEREQRAATTIPFLARNHPAEFAESAYVRENRPTRVSDGPVLIAKKVVKSGLSYGPVLEGLHRLTVMTEAARLPDRLLRRLYRLVFGLHLFRGFRSTWAQAARSPTISAR
jgi:GT2 family glycosyltransferase